MKQFDHFAVDCNPPKKKKKNEGIYRKAFDETRSGSSSHNSLGFSREKSLDLWEINP
jgi:hypothetical protein